MAKPEKQAKQKDLPGMSDRKIPELHAAAEAYVQVRDERMELTKREVEAKERVLKLMHENRKKEYRYEDVTIIIVPEAETVKVKLKKAEEDAESD